MRTAAASWSPSVVSRSFIIASIFAFLEIFAHTVGIPISVGIMDSIPHMRANSYMAVGFLLVVL